jgi:hypothetical protein
MHISHFTGKSSKIAETPSLPPLLNLIKCPLTHKMGKTAAKTRNRHRRQAERLITLKTQIKDIIDDLLIGSFTADV